MARQDALLRLHQNLIARRTELRKRLGLELEELAHIKHSSASGDPADAAFDASGEEISSAIAELEAKELAQIERAITAAQACVTALQLRRDALVSELERITRPAPAAPKLIGPGFRYQGSI